MNAKICKINKTNDNQILLEKTQEAMEGDLKMTQKMKKNRYNLERTHTEEEVGEDSTEEEEGEEETLKTKKTEAM